MCADDEAEGATFGFFIIRRRRVAG